MSQNEIDQLRQLLEQERQRRQEVEQQREEERQQRQEERREDQRRYEEERQQRQEAERQLRDTTLPEFLNGCHEYLFLGLKVQNDNKSSTKGDPANADRKTRPKRIEEWIDFPQEQMEVWGDIMDSDFVTERHFTSLSTLKDNGKQVKSRMLGSELDLGYFERYTVESHVSSVIKELHANLRLRQIFHLHGDVAFENHANTLTDESKIVENLSSLSLTQNQPRRSSRLAAKASSVGRSAAPPERSQPTQPRGARPRADQFCVYNKGPERKDPAFIIEYKAPHKISLAHIKTGLQDMDVDKIVRLQHDESPEDICRRVIAAVITQTFSYMINGGLEYGYVCTGEAFIFLRVLHDDPSTIYYYLSVPQEDVGPSTGWNDSLHADNRLHLTAVGQVLAFTLRALRAPIRNIDWINRAVSGLETWTMIYDDILDEIEEKDIPSSPFKMSRSRKGYLRMSPIKTRSKSAPCNPSQYRRSPSDDDTGDDFNPDDTPSRQPRVLQSSHFSSLSHAQTSQGSRTKGKYRQYCTQQCLRGLIMGGKLDIKCPNAAEHGVDHHELNPIALMHCLDKQLSSENSNCESLHIHGTRGALFKVTLSSHGYTFVGKGVPVEFVEGSKHEELVYSHLTPIQGVYVPAVLGSLDLRRSFSYDGIAEMVHMMFMGYTGKTLVKQNSIDRSQLIQHAEKALQAIHGLGVLHSDPIAGNVTWSKEDEQVMFIDFERATVQKRRFPLGLISRNRNRKRKLTHKRPNTGLDPFDREIRRMRRELQ